MNTRQLLSVGIDIGTTTTQVIFSRLELEPSAHDNLGGPGDRRLHRYHAQPQ